MRHPTLARLAAAAAMATTLCATALPAAAAPAWLTLDEAAWRVLQQQGITHDAVERHVVRTPAIERGTAQRSPRQDTLVLLRVADDAELPRLSLAAHDALHRCGGFMAHASRDDALRTVQRLQARGEGRLTRTAAATAPAYTIDDEAKVQKLLPRLQDTRILDTITQLQGYANRYYRSQTGAKAADDLAQRWADMAAGRSDVSVSRFSHPGFPQQSVMLTVRGATAPDEIIVIGGHLDSISPQAVLRAKGRAPGADDDASGIATLQEVMRVILDSNWKPARTIQFIGYAGEEAGLLGSKDIAARYASENKQVVGVLQLDMTAYEGSASDITLISDYTDGAQDDFVAALASHYLPELTVTRDVCGYACSDHASWTAQGYPASFPFEASFGEDNPHIHTTKDKTDQFGNTASHALKFAKLALAYAVELGSDAPAR